MTLNTHALATTRNGCVYMTMIREMDPDFGNTSACLHKSLYASVTTHMKADIVEVKDYSVITMIKQQNYKCRIENPERLWSCITSRNSTHSGSQRLFWPDRVAFTTEYNTHEPTLPIKSGLTLRQSRQAKEFVLEASLLEPSRKDTSSSYRSLELVPHNGAQEIWNGCLAPSQHSLRVSICPPAINILTSISTLQVHCLLPVSCSSVGGVFVRIR
jgi:hypothetical protein